MVQLHQWSAPMSLQPACMRAAARSGPILTQEAWMLGSARCRVSRATACIRKHSCSVGPFLARPAKEPGAEKARGRQEAATWGHSLSWNRLSQ